MAPQSSPPQYTVDPTSSFQNAPYAPLPNQQTPPPAQRSLGGLLFSKLKQSANDLSMSGRFRTVVGFSLAIAGLLSIVAMATADTEAANLTGRFGVWSSHLLFALFGKAAYLFGPALIFSGLRGLARDDWQAYLSGILGNFSLLWSISVFLYLAASAEPGIAGSQLAMLLEFFTGRAGAYGINLLLGFGGLLLLLQIPFQQVKDRLVDFIENRNTNTGRSNLSSSTLLSRLAVFLPVALKIASDLKSKPAKTADEPDTVHDDPLQGSETDAMKKQFLSTPKTNPKRPPWVEKVVIGDQATSDTTGLWYDEETQFQYVDREPLEDVQDFTKNDDFDDQFDFDQSQVESDQRPLSQLIIEEDSFPFHDASPDQELALSRPASHRIVYDPVKNRYLFRHDADSSMTKAASPRAGVELLDKMQLELHDRFSFDFAEADAITDDTDEAESLANDDHRFEFDSLQSADDDLAFEDEQQELTEPTVIETQQASEDQPSPIVLQAVEIERPIETVVEKPVEKVQIRQPHTPLLPNINMPPVVLSENRFSRYRLSQRIAKRTESTDNENPEAEIKENWQRLEKVMADFGIQAQVVGATRGPMITMYEVKPESGVRVNRILGIQDEIRMNLAALSVRIVAPIPGRSTIGVELPNKNRQYVSMGDLVNGDPEFSSKKRQLSIALGQDITGTNRYIDLTRLPHLLIAGATGSGKSVFMNSVIGSLLFNHSPDEVRFLMVDPKMVELKLFEGIPHLLYPVITDVRLADRALSWAVQEMEARYLLLSSAKCRDIKSYNERIQNGLLEGKTMPYIVILIDELSDLMMVSAKEVEDSIIRLTQKARAVGIHVIMATQRPSVDVITALIKANCPARISFQVAQRTDSRVILDANGAETLLGRGDMLYKSPTAAEPVRMQSPLISDDEIESLTLAASRFGQPRFIDLPAPESDDHRKGQSDAASNDTDQALVDAAWQIIQESGKTSTSYVQRRLRIGYNRAATIIEALEDMGYLGPVIGNRPREILRQS